MADSHHFKKKVKCDISTTVRPILVKFGMAMHIHTPKLMSDLNFENFKIKIADGGHLENQKIVIAPKPFG